MANPVVDIFLVYQFLKRLVTPFDQTDAFRLGLIDADGKRIKRAETPQEKRAIGYFDRLVFNLKRLLAKVPGGSSQIATFAAALLLLREQDNKLISDSSYLESEFQKIFENFKVEDYNHFLKLMEDAGIANVTGAAVAGTGDSGIHWSARQPKMGPKGSVRKYGQPIPGMAFLRRRKNEMIANSNLPKKTVYYKQLKQKVYPYKSSSARSGNGDGDGGNGDGD